MEEGMLVMLDSGVRGGGQIPPAKGAPETETLLNRVKLSKKALQE